MQTATKSCINIRIMAASRKEMYLPPLLFNLLHGEQRINILYVSNQEGCGLMTAALLSDTEQAHSFLDMLQAEIQTGWFWQLFKTTVPHMTTCCNK